MDAIVDKVIATGPIGLFLIAMVLFLRHMNAMSQRHRQCLGDRDKVLSKMSNGMVKAIHKNTKATERLASHIEKLGEKNGKRN